jgi:2-polyprenyl-3-methyl-5-hydroxy-6-metoxy-1,4-benzoquinol methylase
MKQLNPSTNQTLLDAGCGTGYFTQRFYDAGLCVSGIGPDGAMLQYAKSKNMVLFSDY